MDELIRSLAAADLGDWARNVVRDSRKDRPFSNADRGAQLDYEPTQRRSETQRKHELRTQVRLEDESQDDGSETAA